MKHVQGPPTFPDRRRDPRQFPESGMPMPLAAAGFGCRRGAHIEPLSQGQGGDRRHRAALPGQEGVARAAWIQKIADLVHDKKISEISDIEDHSSDKGMRLVIELKRGSIPKVVLNKLYKHTSAADHLRRGTWFALVDNVPKDAVAARGRSATTLTTRREVITRRTKYELRRAEERRAHVLEGPAGRAREPRRG